MINNTDNIIEIEKKNKKNIFSNYKKYILNGMVYYNLSELLIFLKISFNIDYENFLLKVIFLTITNIIILINLFIVG